MLLGYSTEEPVDPIRTECPFCGADSDRFFVRGEEVLGCENCIKPIDWDFLPKVWVNKNK